ncbi:ribonuclease HII [Gehongia tenuis]|uniref:Ribonuclease HII n=1 Tax=Gehongia tenuis TaxID=2763655 RepID=A0A926D3Q3_9FIRM|nr:ribonuclease HII [Gehongia tenuis]MBC8530986.1 ribonuclease HII [Gehongia tenuis]
MKGNNAELLAFERRLKEEGITVIAGVDEAGRGPLAGPVVAAAVVLGTVIEGVNDSKKLSEKKRELLYDRITREAVAYGIGQVDPRGIDEMNIRNATLAAMKQAVENLGIALDRVLVDGRDVIDVKYPVEAVVHGDATCYSIAAASILAKVTRDRQMRELDAKYPEYGFGQHKGYGTAAHIEVLRRIGPCPIHRASFLRKIL